MLMLAVTKHIAHKKVIKVIMSRKRPLSLGGLLKLAMGLYCKLLPVELYLNIPMQKL